MTGTMDEKEGQTTSIHVKQNDARVARRYGYEDRGPGVRQWSETDGSGLEPVHPIFR